jgi:pyridoxamine 5'-phosphate oxidase
MSSDTPESLARHTDYGHDGLVESDITGNPLAHVEQWIREAEAADIFEPNAMVLSTINPDGRPSNRTVLLKGLDTGNSGDTGDTGAHPNGALEFVTNYESRKGRALLANPQASVLFPWYAIKRQVIITGVVEPTEPPLSDSYFDRRPHGARLAAIASDQSQPVESRDVLEVRMRDLESQFPEGTHIPRPENWGGFRLIPATIEFWQGRSMRFHDRLFFTRQPDGTWTRERLQP